MHKLEQGKQLSKSFTGLTYIDSKQNYNTRVATNALDIPQSNTATCRTFSGKTNSTFNSIKNIRILFTK